MAARKKLDALFSKKVGNVYGSVPVNGCETVFLLAIQLPIELKMCPCDFSCHR
jgi:hypothetical protein